MSIFVFGRGFGNILAAPISSSLLRMKFIRSDHLMYGYYVKGYVSDILLIYGPIFIEI